MESKLEAYRLRKRRKETFENIKQKFLKMIPFQGNKQSDENKSFIIETEPNKIPPKLELIESDSDSQSDIEIIPNDETVSQPITITESTWVKYTMWLIYFVFWATCYAIAIELKFGIVYLLFSALFGMYFNTRTGPRRENEISAYSVFNKDCESIDGTLKAEQFEREIRYGPTACVR